MPLTSNKNSQEMSKKRTMRSTDGINKSTVNNSSKVNTCPGSRQAASLQKIAVVEDARGLLTYIIVAVILLGFTISCLLLVSGYFYDFTDATVQQSIKFFVEAFYSIVEMGNYIKASFYNLLKVVFRSFTEAILHFIVLLDAHFLGGIPGLAILLVVVVLIILFGQKFYRLCNNYTKCIAYKKRLQMQLEETERQLQEELQKVKEQEIQNSQKQKQTQALHLKSEKLRKTNLNYERERDQRLCRVCKKLDRTILLLPCQHMCWCKQCFKKKIKKCPICNKVIKSTMEIYV